MSTIFRIPIRCHTTGTAGRQHLYNAAQHHRRPHFVEERRGSGGRGKTQHHTNGNEYGTKMVWNTPAFYCQ